MKIFLTISLSIICLHTSSQTLKHIAERSAIDIGYDYLGRNSLGVGLNYNLPINEYNWHGYNVGLGIRYFKGENNAHLFVPEAKISYRYYGLLFAVHTSTKNFAPIVGLSFMNCFHLYSGYSFAFEEDKNQLKGIIFGIKLFISGKNSQFYDRLKIGF
ncbi:hypothetical protein [Capnocytophaga canimorsus]|uniref:hypothetical protein n=1 Tax=Capnocytophaga canimorsus TaxID=28188 RepID=UPI0037D1A09A